MNIIWLGLAAFGGGVFAGILGWIKSGEDFVPRKFAGTVLTALLAGFVIAVAWFETGSVVTVLDLILVALAGAGVDVTRNRIAGTI